MRYRNLSSFRLTVMDQEKSSTSPSIDAATNGGVSAKRVLLVEDDRSVRRYLEVTLQRSGYQVLTAGDGLEAMKLALTSVIDVVVTDAIMPHMSGQELARFLRSNPKLSRLPIILLTGQENKLAAATPENVVDVFLYKPIKAEELKSCLTKLLSRDS